MEKIEAKQITPKHRNKKKMAVLNQQKGETGTTSNGRPVFFNI